MVARQGHRAGGQLRHCAGAGDHPAVIQAAGPVKGQHPAVGHISRAQGAVAPAVADLQNPALDRGQAAQGVRPGPGHRVASLLRRRARAGEVPRQSGRVGTVKHQGRVVQDVAGHPARRSPGAQLQGALRNRGRGLRPVAGEDQGARARLGQVKGPGEIARERQRSPGHVRRAVGSQGYVSGKEARPVGVLHHAAVQGQPLGRGVLDVAEVGPAGGTHRRPTCHRAQGVVGREPQGAGVDRGRASVTVAGGQGLETRTDLHDLAVGAGDRAGIARAGVVAAHRQRPVAQAHFTARGAATGQRSDRLVKPVQIDQHSGHIRKNHRRGDAERIAGDTGLEGSPLHHRRTRVGVAGRQQQLPVPLFDDAAGDVVGQRHRAQRRRGDESTLLQHDRRRRGVAVARVGDDDVGDHARRAVDLRIGRGTRAATAGDLNDRRSDVARPAVRDGDGGESLARRGLQGLADRHVEAGRVELRPALVDRDPVQIIDESPVVADGLEGASVEVEELVAGGALGPDVTGLHQPPVQIEGCVVAEIPPARVQGDPALCGGERAAFAHGHHRIFSGGVTHRQGRVVTVVQRPHASAHQVHNADLPVDGVRPADVEIIGDGDGPAVDRQHAVAAISRSDPELGEAVRPPAHLKISVAVGPTPDDEVIHVRSRLDQQAAPALV